MTLFSVQQGAVVLIGIIADSHDHLLNLRNAINAVQDLGAEAIIHAGDFVAPFAIKELLKARVPVHAVFGNNDGERKGIRNLFPEIQDPPLVLELGGRKIIVDHYPEVVDACKAQNPDVLIYGHTHEILVETGPPLVLNPGECCGWLTGRPTCGLLDTETLEPEIIDL